MLNRWFQFSDSFAIDLVQRLCGAPTIFKTKGKEVSKIEYRAIGILIDDIASQILKDDVQLQSEQINFVAEGIPGFLAILSVEDGLQRELPASTPQPVMAIEQHLRSLSRMQQSAQIAYNLSCLVPELTAPYLYEESPAVIGLLAAHMNVGRQTHMFNRLSEDIAHSVVEHMVSLFPSWIVMEAVVFETTAPYRKVLQAKSEGQDIATDALAS